MTDQEVIEVLVRELLAAEILERKAIKSKFKLATRQVGIIDTKQAIAALTRAIEVLEAQGK